MAKLQPQSGMRAPSQRKVVAAPPRTPFVRLLPALIFVAALMLSVRANDIWKGVSGLGAVRVARAVDLVAEVAAQDSRHGAECDTE